MTEVSFHTKVADPLGYACRLLRKAVRKGAQVAVTADAETLRQLDRALWSFDPLDFVPHATLRAGESVPPRLQRTPIWLLTPGATAPVHDVLVNLGTDLAPGFETFKRVVEVVGNGPTETQAARQRWRHYKERGYDVAHHEASA
jgi:DNA polymerase-3 subunit chi